MQKVKIDSLGLEIKRMLDTSTVEYSNAVKKAVEKKAQEVVQSLKGNPNIPVKTGKYRKSFYKKKLSEGDGFIKIVIANKEAHLTHLLEFGHINWRNGKRVRAFPHWKQAQEEADRLFDELQKELGAIK